MVCNQPVLKWYCPTSADVCLNSGPAGLAGSRTKTRGCGASCDLHASHALTCPHMHHMPYMSAAVGHLVTRATQNTHHMKHLLH
jgi:hypothetical protein